MYIYNSTQVRPYVYLCTHKETGKFYIGYREKNVKLNLTSDQDLPLYKTSSNIVKSNFAEYTWEILAEFTTGDSAYDFEQQLISENWNNPLLLNESCRYGSTNRFKDGMLGKTHNIHTKEILRANKQGKTYEELYGPDKAEELKKNASVKSTGRRHTDKTKEKLSEIFTGHVVLDETKQKIRERSLEEWKTRPRKMSEETKAKIGLANKGRKLGPKSEETKAKLRGKIPWNKGLKLK
jgi:hypothetical protein